MIYDSQVFNYLCFLSFKGYIGDREAAESSDPHSRNTRTDSEAGLFQPYKSDTPSTPARRNSVISSSKQVLQNHETVNLANLSHKIIIMCYSKLYALFITDFYCRMHYYRGVNKE